MEQQPGSARPRIQPGSGGRDRPDGRSHVVRIVGPLDAFSALGVEGDLGRLIAEHPRLTVDLCDVEVLTSGGLAMLERSRFIAVRSGHSLRFRVRPDSIVERVVRMGALPDLAAATERRATPRPSASEGA